MPNITIAIDGPAGAGKSTIAKAIAKHFGILYLDTGAMYRAVALKALRLGVDPSDLSGVLTFLDSVDISVKYIDGTQHTFLDGEDVTGLIRTPEVTKGSSDIAVLPPVRIKLVELQRKIAANTDLVMDGRDIGTNVLPDAPFKFYITASPEERARRRVYDLQLQGIKKDIAEVKAQIIDRDRVDSTREFAPLKQAPDAYFLDTTQCSVEQSVQTVLDYIEQKKGIK